jgi:hypothetical protein
MKCVNARILIEELRFTGGAPNGGAADKCGLKNSVHVCANCNSGWHSKCIAQLYATRKELSLKGKRGQGSRKVRGAHTGTNYLLYWYTNTNADALKTERRQGSRR